MHDGNQYEVLKNRFLTEVEEKCGSMSIDQLQKIMSILDFAAQGFDIRQMETSLSIQDGSIPEVVKTYLAVKTVEGLSKHTLKNKGYRLAKFFGTVCKPIDKITANDIRAYLYRYQEQTNICNATLDGIRIVICSFFRWAACEEYIPKDPSVTVRPIKCEKKQRAFLTQIELEYIRKACCTLRERAMIEFFYSTGCRVSELCAVKITDVDFLTSEVTLFGKGRKYRTSYLNAKATVAIKEYLKSRKDDCEYLFCTERHPHRQVTKAGIEKSVREIMARVPEVKKNVTPHIFRHTTATQAVRSGMPIDQVQRILGHSSVATTMRYVNDDLSEVKASHIKAVV